jgi:hypothetical protein
MHSKLQVASAVELLLANSTSSEQVDNIVLTKNSILLIAVTGTDVYLDITNVTADPVDETLSGIAVENASLWIPSFFYEG